MAHPDDAIVVTTAPTWSQVEQLLWREIAAAYSRSKVALGGRLLTTRLDLEPRWYAIGLATDQPVNLQGFHSTNLLVVIDEADGVPASIWTALDGILTTANAKTLAIGNPLNSASEFKRRHDSGLSRPDSICIKISADDVLPLTDGGKHPYLLQRAWVDDKRERWGESSALYLGKILAEWPDQSTDLLIPLPWLERARGRTVPKGLRVLGVDVARFGSARTVRTLLEGNWLAWTRATSREDTMATAGRVMADVSQYGPVVVAVDDTGVGGAVTDRLRQLGQPVTAVNFGAKAWDEGRFANRGSELYFAVRKAFEENYIGFSMEDPDAIDELVSELNQPTYETDERGRIRVDKLGRGRDLTEEDRAAHSPDRADSFVIAYGAVQPMLQPQPERPQQTRQPTLRDWIDADIEQITRPFREGDNYEPPGRNGWEW
jgi:hypothetical protein